MRASATSSSPGRQWKCSASARRARPTASSGSSSGLIRAAAASSRSRRSSPRPTPRPPTSQELIKAAREQLELVRDLKLAASIGETPDKAQPKRAPFWRSNLTAPSISANLATIAALAGADGIGAALPRDKAWAAGQVTFELRQVEAVLARVAALTPWVDLAAAPEANADLRYTLIPLGDVRALLETDYPDALGLITGFNSLDGD